MLIVDLSGTAPCFGFISVRAMISGFSLDAMQRSSSILDKMELSMFE